MDLETSTIRLLGVVQLIVIVGAVIMDRPLASLAESSNISDILLNIPGNLNRIRISNLVALGTSLAIVLWGVLYYIVFNNEYQIISVTTNC